MKKKQLWLFTETELHKMGYMKQQNNNVAKNMFFISLTYHVVYSQRNKIHFNRVVIVNFSPETKK